MNEKKELKRMNKEEWNRRISESMVKKRGEKLCNCEKQQQNCSGPLYTTAATSESQACFVHLPRGWSASKVLAIDRVCTARQSKS